MKIDGLECLPVLSLHVQDQPTLNLEKFAAARLMTGDPIRFDRVAIRVSYIEVDMDGGPLIVDGQPVVKTVEHGIVALEVGIVREDQI